jgi:hypothetical protein
MRVFLAGALLAGLCLPAMALPDPVADGLRRCAHETDRNKRLQCFDALVGQLPGLEADQVGMTRDIARHRESAPPPSPASAQAPAAAPPAEVLSGKIVALRAGAGGVLIFTLDNQQVWMQSEPNPRVQFAVGDAVRIEHGSMGSLWLAAANSRKTRVKRVS